MLNATWVNLPIIPTQKLPIHIDCQWPDASCEIRQMPTQCHEMARISPATCDPSKVGKDHVLASGTVVAFSLACRVKQYLIIGNISDE
jgi:hypothetical protein